MRVFNGSAFFPMRVHNRLTSHVWENKMRKPAKSLSCTSRSRYAPSLSNIVRRSCKKTFYTLLYRLALREIGFSDVSPDQTEEYSAASWILNWISFLSIRLLYGADRHSIVIVLSRIETTSIGVLMIPWWFRHEQVLVKSFWGQQYEKQQQRTWLDGTNYIHIHLTRCRTWPKAQDKKRKQQQLSNTDTGVIVVITSCDTFSSIKEWSIVSMEFSGFWHCGNDYLAILRKEWYELWYNK